MTQFELVAEPFYPLRSAPRREKDSSPGVMRHGARALYLLMRFVLFGLQALLARPFVASLMSLCIWSTIQVGLTLSQQTRMHPAPLFQQKVLPKGAMPGIPRELFQPLAQVPPQNISDVRLVQQLLSERGLYKGTVDGRLGPETTHAIRAFQEQSDLTADGTLSEELIKRLKDKTAFSPRYESDAILIFSVQRRLNQLGYAVGNESGEISPQMKLALEKFEADHGLPITGTISGQLLRSLTAALGSHS